jgi:hypothetical protein
LLAKGAEALSEDCTMPSKTSFTLQELQELQEIKLKIMKPKQINKMNLFIAILLSLMLQM